MIAKLKTNRVFRAYRGGSRIDELCSGLRSEDGCFPEDWLASTVKAFNPGREDVEEGYGATEDGIPIRELVPEGLSVLVKLLDSAERLVIQAHPTRAFAEKAFRSPVGKTECWYMLATSPEACVYIGFREGVTREKWVALCRAQDVDGMLSCLHRFPVKAGDCVFVPGGVPHAIGGGCLMMETQEPSDLMVIPERFSPSGNRISDAKMHGGLGFEKMYDCFEYDGLSEEAARKRFFFSPVSLDDAFSCVVNSKDNGIFGVYSCETAKPVSRSFRESFAIGVVTEGEAELRLGGERCRVAKGDRILMLELSGKEFSVAPVGGPFRLAFALPA